MATKIQTFIHKQLEEKLLLDTSVKIIMREKYHL